MIDDPKPLEQHCKPRGGFVKYGQFIWIDMGSREHLISPAHVIWATLEFHDWRVPQQWGVNVNVLEHRIEQFYFDTEDEARRFVAVLAGETT